jgi:hypothetical protein
MNIRIVCVAMLACLPLFAYGDAYKCERPDGNISYQDHPCDKGADGHALTLPTSPPGSESHPYRELKDNAATRRLTQGKSCAELYDSARAACRQDALKIEKRCFDRKYKRHCDEKPDSDVCRANCALEGASSIGACTNERLHILCRAQ